MLEQYPTQVKVVFKNFPLQSHKFARQAAAAALAAADQGRFWEFHDELFRNYSRINDQTIREIAEKVGLDLGKFDASLKSQSVQTRINEDIQEALQAGVRGTPTIFVNGRLLRNRSLEGFRELIDKELAKREKKD